MPEKEVLTYLNQSFTEADHYDKVEDFTQGGIFGW